MNLGSLVCWSSCLLQERVVHVHLCVCVCVRVCELVLFLGPESCWCSGVVGLRQEEPLPCRPPSPQVRSARETWEKNNQKWGLVPCTECRV